jgi:glucose/arabinose dehydrogenase
VSRFRRRFLAVLSTAALLVPTASISVPAVAAPRTTVTSVVAGLQLPWDVTWIGDLMLFNERSGRVWSKRPGATPVQVSLPLPPIYTRGEAGLLGMVADPSAKTNRNFYTCMSVATPNGEASDVQVWKWRLTNDSTAVRVSTLVKGIPIENGGHNGCRLVFRSSRYMYIGTGDAVNGTAPQDLSSLGGKILRVRSDGYVPKTNPFYSRGGNARYVWNYGHRNVQGLAKRPGVSELWSVEHGPTRDDEINLVVKGGNYGWNPVPGYNEDVPMTDLARYSKAITAKWTSGSPTVATSGATFLSGSRWGSWNGVLAVAMLKGQGIMLFTVDSRNRLTPLTRIATSYGRIRTVNQGTDGLLYFTTSNGDNDAVYRITPS